MISQGYSPKNSFLAVSLKGYNEILIFGERKTLKCFTNHGYQSLMDFYSTDQFNLLLKTINSIGYHGKNMGDIFGTSDFKNNRSDPTANHDPFTGIRSLLLIQKTLPSSNNIVM